MTVIGSQVWMRMGTLIAAGASLPGDVQIASEIPEPLTLLLVGAGGVLLYRRRRRRRR